MRAYIAGLPRGATTLVSQVIGCSPETQIAGETMYIGHPGALSKECSCGDIQCNVLEERITDLFALEDAQYWNYAYGLIDYFFEPNKERSIDTISHTPRNSETVSDLKQIISRAVDSIISIADYYDSITGHSKVIVDNSKEIHVAEHFFRNNDDWKVILVTRDIRGTWNSVRNAAHRKGVERLLEDKLAVWHEYASVASSLIHEGVFHIQYERLCEEPIFHTHRIADYLNITIDSLSWDPSNHHVQYGNRAMKKKKILEIKKDSTWLNSLPDSDKAILENEFREYDFLIT